VSRNNRSRSVKQQPKAHRPTACDASRHEAHIPLTSAYTIEPPTAQSADFRPTVLMGRISDAFTEHGPLAQRRIEAAVTGKAASIRIALDCLILDGYVTDKSPHKLIKPYLVSGDSQ
jgi:hypothetical protein